MKLFKLRENIWVNLEQVTKAELRLEQVTNHDAPVRRLKLWFVGSAGTDHCEDPAAISRILRHLDAEGWQPSE